MTKQKNIEQSQIHGLPEVNNRTLKHRRTFCYEVYHRDDGLWDIDAQMLDYKNRELIIGGQVISKTEPLHNMLLRLTLDDSMTIVAVQTMIMAAPYPQQCTQITNAYDQLIGLNVLNRFRDAVKERFAKTSGCTHVSELANTLPTVAIQGIGTELSSQKKLPTDQKPFQLDQCHALRSNGEVARLYYHKWYVEKE